MRTIVCLLAALCFAACKKDPRPAPPPATQPLSGVWAGKYGTRAVNAPGDTVFVTPMHKFTMIFHPNGTMVVYDGDEGAALVANGVYSLQNGKFYGQYSYFRGGSGEFSLHAVLEKPDSLAGTWHIGYGGQTGGRFYLGK